MKLFVTGCLLPVCCFILLGSGPDGFTFGMWQSGEFKVYAALLLKWQAAALFLPLIAYSIVALACWTWNPALAHRWHLRWGIYSGGILSVQFLILVVGAFELQLLGMSLLVGGALAAITWVAFLVCRRSKRFAIREVMLLTSIVAVACAGLRIFGLPEEVLDVMGAAFMCLVVATPGLNCLTYVRSSLCLLARRRKGFPIWKRIATIAAWLAAWLLAWKLAVESMLAEYAKLPTQPPDCYVCTAAATGHAAWVKAEWITVEGQRVRVNQQMRRLKMLEFMLLAALPPVHRLLRVAYDHIGPKCAGLCHRSVWFADASYLLLMPPAWAAEQLRRLAQVSAQRVDQLWR